MSTPTTTESSPSDSWLPDLLRSAGLAAGASLDDIQREMDHLADSAAPIARTWWKWIILVQGMSVVVPILWLMRRTLGLGPSTVALISLAAVVIFIAGLWWMRWRGMQRTWARARVVAEVARSQVSAAVCPSLPARRVLGGIPAVLPLLTIHDAAKIRNWPEWKETWISDRLDGQLDYYRGAREKAEKTRQKLSRWATLFMDVMLALSASGVVLTLSARAPQWLRILGDQRLECVLGAAGVLLPLGIILLQSLRQLQELNRRTARFARQITMLEKARRELQEASTPEKALQIIAATDDQLLSEVVDWYFAAETAEQFFRVRGQREQAKAQPLDQASTAMRQRLAHWVWSMGGVGLLFVCQVVLARVPWLAGASAVTLAWLSYSAPADSEERSRLRGEGVLVDEAGRPWNLDPLRAPNGCIIIAHGLHDGATFTAEGAESRWMREMSQALEKKLRDKAPNIGLVDWAAAAAPTNIHRLDPKVAAARFLGDLAGIPSMGREVGDFLAFRLSQLILEGKIDRRAPLHLIGHSAGGFVVSRAALRLHQMNLAPKVMHVTILDTPAPDSELLVDVPNACPVDFYVTSGFVRGLDDKRPPKGVYLKHIPFQGSLTLLQQHSYAYQWYTRTIPTARMGESGFGRSPFVREAGHQPDLRSF